MQNLREEGRYVLYTLVLIVRSFAKLTPPYFVFHQVYAAGSEDMDTLTFSAPTLFRHLTFSEAKKAPITEVTLTKALEGLGMEMSQVRLLPSTLPYILTLC